MLDATGTTVVELSDFHGRPHARMWSLLPSGDIVETAIEPTNLPGLDDSWEEPEVQLVLEALVGRTVQRVWADRPHAGIHRAWLPLSPRELAETHDKRVEERGSTVGLHPERVLAMYAVEQDAPTRVLILIADDFGVDVMRAYSGAGAPMPNVERVCDEGIRFERAWANHLCSPTRATLVTGRYGFRTGIGTAAPRAAPRGGHAPRLAQPAHHRGPRQLRQVAPGTSRRDRRRPGPHTHGLGRLRRPHRRHAHGLLVVASDRGRHHHAVRRVPWTTPSTGSTAGRSRTIGCCGSGSSRPTPPCTPRPRTCTTTS
ncbi:MAG: sulfatase-like hydrolase/transferase [Proteobacteria bacterium]|nr:sulfatase-like hydrolase/transferase [Pseudomonadota bacterium]MCP4916387.1 sulfatase-like hydrolase/transferase [Pseudomonadota bacterium]